MYNDELQIKFMFRSGWHTFKGILVFVLELIFGVQVCNDELQIELKFPSSWPTVNGITALGLRKFQENGACVDFFWLCLHIFSSYLMCNCIMMSYRSSLRFVTVNLFLTEFRPLNMVHNIYTMYVCYDELQIGLNVLLSWALLLE